MIQQERSGSRLGGRWQAPTPLAIIRELVTEIGPRPATSKAEAQAAAVVAGLFRRSGLEVTILPFPAAAAPVLGMLVPALIGIVAALLGSWLPLPSAMLALWAAIVAWRELRGPPLLATLLRQRDSQNVIGARAAADAPRWRVVLLCHLDTPRVLSTLQTRLLRLFLLMPPLLLTVLAGLLSGARWWPLLRLAALVPGGLLLLSVVVMLWRERRARWSPGAVSAAGTAVAAAAVSELHDLRFVELWAVATGAGAAGGAGTSQILRRYPFPPEETCFINLPALGMGQLSLITLEGPLRRLRSDRFLGQLIVDVAAREELELDQLPIAGERLESTAVLARGYHAVSLAGLSTAGTLAGYRSPLDDPEQLDPDQLASSQRLLVAVIRQLEAIAAGKS